MTLTTPQMILLAGCALAAIGVGVYLFYLSVGMIRGIYQAAMASLPARRARIAIIVGVGLGAVVGLVLWGYIFMMVFQRW